MKSALIIGLGHFGKALVEELVERKCELVVLEQDEEKAQQVKALVQKVIIADATNKEILIKFARQVDCAIVCLGERIDSSVLITYYLKEIGAKKIIAKASSNEHGQILKAVGADEVLFPERETAKRLAISMTRPDILDLIKLSEEFNIVETSIPDQFINRTIRDLALRNKFGIEVLAIKNVLTGKMTVMPQPDYKFNPDEIMIIIGGAESIEKFSTPR